MAINNRVCGMVLYGLQRQGVHHLSMSSNDRVMETSMAINNRVCGMVLYGLQIKVYLLWEKLIIITTPAQHEV